MHYAANEDYSKKVRTQLTKSSNKRPFSLKTEQLTARDEAVNSLLNVKSIGEETSSDSIPIVKFSTSGELKSSSILKAVPVYIVGEGGAGEVYVKK